jgi:hypothetical protein
VPLGIRAGSSTPQIRCRSYKREEWEKGNASSWAVRGRIIILNPSEGNGQNEGCSFG